MNTLQDKASAVSAAHEQARARLSAVEARIADALAREQTALLTADLDAAGKAHAEADAAKSELPSASAAVESLAAASLTLAEQVREAQHRDERQRLQDALDGTRLELDGLLIDARTEAAAAAEKLRQAVALEQEFVAIQIRLEEFAVALGERESRQFSAWERPLQAVLAHAPILLQLAHSRPNDI